MTRVGGRGHAGLGAFYLVLLDGENRGALDAGGQPLRAGRWNVDRGWSGVDFPDGAEGRKVVAAALTTDSAGTEEQLETSTEAGGVVLGAPGVQGGIQAARTLGVTPVVEQADVECPAVVAGQASHAEAANQFADRTLPRPARGQAHGGGLALGTGDAHHPGA